MKKFIRIIALLLSILCVLPFAISCAQDNGNDSETSGQDQTQPEEKDFFADFDYQKKPFKVYTSTNVASAGMGNSNFMIEGEGEYGKGLVSDAVYDRNIAVQDILNTTFEFTEIDAMYTEVANNVRNITKSGDYVYDLIINDLFPLAGLSIDGMFMNTLAEDTDNYLDFSQKYWYSDYMSDLTMINGYQYLLAGDYFADVIRSAHCLIYNKNMYNDIYHDPDHPYDMVSNYEWTYDSFLETITGVYKDLDGDSEISDNDRFGFILCDRWGGSIPFITSGGCNYISRDEDGLPEVVLYCDRTIDLVDNLMKIIYSDDTSYDLFSDEQLLTTFMNKQALFVGYQRLGSLENLTSREVEIGIIPYPMLYANERHYTTSSHDTTEIGVIPTTAFQEFSRITAILEVLCRETSRIVMPQYYEVSLKVRYADDEKAAEMIDIIHDGFGNTFQLAYDSTLNDCYKNIIYYGCIEKKTNTIASSAAKTIKSANKALEKKITSFKKNNHVED